ncbi:hypothetical protein JMUB7528_28550 [Staphylococcus aureus]
MCIRDREYIIFPNPMYGSWEATIYNNNYKASDKAKDKLRKNAIKQFDPKTCLLYTSPSPRDMRRSRMPSSA